MTAPLSEKNLNDSVTEHMRRDFARLFVYQTVGEALASVRRNPPEGRIIYFYVVDEDNRLQGVVPTRRLLLNALDTPLADVMIRNVIALPARATVLEACEFFTLHRFLAFPVLDDERHLVGVVDMELYTDELSDLGGRDKHDTLFQLIGVHVAHAKQTSPLKSFRHRFPWLACNLSGGIAAAFLSGLYEEELKQVVALALFLPVVLALAESVSIQSVSLAVESLHGEVPTLRVLIRRLRGEWLTGLLLGGAGGLAVGLIAWVWLGWFAVALSIGAGIAAGVACAAAIGLAMPTILRLLQRDPSVAAGPIALAASDVVTLLFYFNFARWLLRP
jgi:magnesium transporter